MMTTEQYGMMLELRGRVCACGSDKWARTTFCGKCFHSITRDMRKALYNRIGNGYERAYSEARAELVRQGRVKAEAA
jgi:hypothetical protein